MVSKRNFSEIEYIQTERRFDGQNGVDD